MTIILQHQFWGLKVKDETFEVTLTFKKLPATLLVPFAALTAFFDPGVQFGLQFRGEQAGSTKSPVAPTAFVPHAPAPADDNKENAEDTPEKAPAAPREGEVVSLDQFRKK
jgi:hypothetical protein